jgi:hypothetical protein
MRSVEEENRRKTKKTVRRRQLEGKNSNSAMPLCDDYGS